MTYGDNKIKANWNESNTMGDNLTANGGVVGTNYSNGANYDKIRTTTPHSHLRFRDGVRHQQPRHLQPHHRRRPVKRQAADQL